MEALVGSTIPPGWQHTYWDVVYKHPLHTPPIDLILAVAVPFTSVARGLLERLRTQRGDRPILAVLPDDADCETVSCALSLADDFLFWPSRPMEILLRMRRLMGAGTVPSGPEGLDRLREELALMKLVGHAPSFLRAVQQVPRVAKSAAPLLLLGETGTGKELFARAVHHLSPRRDRAFIPVDCGVLPDHLFENEFFGHARGAYTDAHAEQKGLAALAEGGTIFLDEIDALSLRAQAKLLRYLQEGTYRPLGSERIVRTDVHVIAATNQDLLAAVREKRFREDLYFRLNVLSLRLPALRERAEDIGTLARYAAHTLGERKLVSAGAIEKLKLHHWPGNVRELFNVIQRAAHASDEGHILPGHIDLPGLADPPESQPTAIPRFQQAREETVIRFERTYVAELLRQHHGNVSQAARAAGKERRAFGKLAKKYGIDPRNFVA